VTVSFELTVTCILAQYQYKIISLQPDKDLMKRKILLILLPVFLLACKTLLPGSAVRPEPLITSTSTAALKTTAPPPTVAATIPNPTMEIAVPEPTVEITTPAPTGSGTTAVRLNPGDGKLVDLLAAEVKKAETLGQIPVVEFDADW